MTEYSRQDARQVMSESEYIKAADSFARYAHKEWMEGNLEDRALLMCCIDRTISDGTGYMRVITGDRDLVTAAVMRMMDDEDLQEIFRKARVASETTEDLDKEIRKIRSRLRVFYILAVVATVWTVFLVAFHFLVGGSWLMTISNLLLMVFVGIQVGRGITDLRSMLQRLTSADRRYHEERAEHFARTFFDALRRRIEQDGDDDDE